MINKQLKFIYKFMFKPVTKLEKIKRIVYMVVVAPLLITLSLLIMFSSAVVTYGSIGTVFKLSIIAMFIYPLFAIRVFVEVKKGHTELKISKGMTRKEFIKGNMYSMQFYVFVIFTSYFIHILTKLHDPSIVIAWYFFTISIHLLMFNIFVFITVSSKNVFSILLMYGILTLLMILAFGVTSNSASSTKVLWLNTYASKVSTIWIIAGSFTIVSFAILQVSSLFSLSSWFIEAGDVSTQNQIKIKQYFDKGMNILFKLY